MKITKLPSGKWHTTVYSHTDGSGKRKYKSITAPTKSACELKAAEFKANKTRRTFDDLTVRDCLIGYVDAKRGVLSPSTMREYDRALKSDFKAIQHKRVCKLTNEDMQVFISTMSATLSPKSVRNRYGLLRSAVAFYYPELTFKVTFPAKQVKRPESPSDDAVRRLYDAADEKLKICIALGCRGLRRGEICALKYEDIQNGIAHIHADMVKDSKARWIYKEIPKTDGSDRYVRVPDLGDGDGFIVSWTPDSVTKRFIDLKKSLGIDIKFHDLRHYFASSASTLNVPDIYTADFGGWSRSGRASVMKSVYQNNIKSMSEYYAKKIENHISDVLNAKEDAN